MYFMIERTAGGYLEEAGRGAGLADAARAERLLDEQRGVLELIAEGQAVGRCLEELCLAVERADPEVRVCVVLASGDRARIGVVVGPRVARIAEGLRGSGMGDGWGATCARSMVTGGPSSCADVEVDTRWSGEWRRLCLSEGVRATYSTPIGRAGALPVGSVCLCLRAAGEPTAWVKRLGATAAALAGAALGREASPEVGAGANGLVPGDAGFRAIVESQAEMVCRFTPDGTILYANGAYERARGAEPGGLVGTNLWQSIPEKDRAGVKAVLETLSPAAPEVRIENRFVSGSDVKWTLWCNRGLAFDAAGRAVEVQSTGIDITERKQAEQERESLLGRERAARDEAETLNEIGRTLAGELDLQRLVQSVTDAATRLTAAQFGAFFYHAADEGGGSFRLSTLSGTAPRSFEQGGLAGGEGMFERVFRGGSVVRVGDARAHGEGGGVEGGAPELSARSYLAVPVVSRAGQVLGGLFLGHADPGVFTERAERLAAGIAALAAVAIDNARLYDAAQKSWAQVREMAHSAPAMLWVSEPDGSSSFQSRGWCEYTGQSEERALRFGWMSAVHPDDRPRMRQVLREANAKQTAFSIDYRIRRADGAYRWAIDTGRPRFGAAGEFLGFIGSVIDVHERKQAEGALRESEERLRLAAESTGVGAYDFDLLSRKTVWSPQLRRILGVTEDAEGSEDLLARLVHPDDRERLAQDVGRACEPSGKSRHEFEFRIVRPDGEVRWLHDTGQVLFEGEGRRPVRIIGAVQDITERKKTEQRLAVARAVTHVLAVAGSVAEAAPAVLGAIATELGVEVCNLWLPDEGGGVLRCAWTHTRSAEAAFEPFLAQSRSMTMAEGVGLPGRVWQARAARWLESVTEDTNFPRASSARAAGLSSGAAVPVLSADRFLGVIEFFSVRKMPPDEALLSKLSALGSDFGQFLLRTRAEESLRESEERFRTLADNMSQFAWMTDAKGWIFWYNKRWHDYTGSTLEEMRGWGWMKVHHPDHVYRVAEKFQRCWEMGTDWEDVFPLRGKDGTYRWFLSRAMPIRDEAGKIVRWFGTNTDITERREMEEALARHKVDLERRVEERTRELTATYERLRMSERMAMMGTLSAGLGHDLGNLLVPVRVRLESLSREPLTEQAKEDVDAIRTSAEYLRRLAHGLRLLALDPQHTPEGETTDLPAWWADVEGILRSVLPRGIVLDAHVPPIERLARMSKAALTQVVFNLVQNAGDALRERGVGRVNVRAWSEGTLACVSVSDDGPGMTAEVRERCMEPFFTTKTRGISTGLGLVLVYGLVREAGGTVELKSEPGAGTTFVLRLPAVKSSEPEQDAVDQPARVAVLDVRDPRMRSFIASELRSLRFTIDGSGENVAGAALVVVDDTGKLGAVPREVPAVFLGEAPGAGDHVRVLGGKPGISVIREALRQAAKPGRRA
jgi:PAS domain S-box-containing protein